MSGPFSVAAMKNFRRMIQSIRRYCFGSIVRGLLNLWIGSITSEPQESNLGSPALHGRLQFTYGFPFETVLPRREGFTRAQKSGVNGARTRNLCRDRAAL
jgi:hypothetical protein